jgi:maleylacetate reductase
MLRSGVFQYLSIERVRYGTPFEDAVAAEAKLVGAQRVFVLASGTLVRKTDCLERLESALAGKFVGLYAKVSAHTPRDTVVAAAKHAREAGADLIVTLGGGSVTDGGKMMVLCLANDVHDPTELDRYFTRVGEDGMVEQPNMAAPNVGLICVPTTLSAGEFNFTAGCTDTVSKTKHLFRHAKYVPRCIVLDPSVTCHTPEWLWLSTGVRAVDHAVEDLCSRDSHPFVDGTAIHALKLLGRALPRVKADPEDLKARLDCQTGAWMSMNGALAGVTKGASHGIGHVLGGTAKVPHGHTSCVMLPNVLRYNHSVNSDQQAQVSAALGREDETAAFVLRDLIAGLDQPTRLRSVGVTKDQFDVIARNAMHDRWIHTNPRPITEQAQIRDILEMAW